MAIATTAVTSASTTTTLKFNVPVNLSWEMWTGNINNDGKSDLFFLSRYGSQSDPMSMVSLVSGKSGYTVKQQALEGGSNTGARILLTDDFNKDRKSDLMMYNAGTYTYSSGGSYFNGVTPYFYSGNGKGDLVKTDQLSQAYNSVIGSAAGWGNGVGKQSDATIAAKTIASGDINNDGYADLFVESTGAQNSFGHFVMGGAKGFTIDTNNRLSDKLYLGDLEAHGGLPTRYFSEKIVDVNRDGSKDLILGQLKGPQGDWAGSMIVFNDKKGYFTEANAVKLSSPDFNSGHTRVNDSAVTDINRDGLNDIVMLHQRYDQDGSGWGGTFLQVLIQTASRKFEDQSAKYLGGQDIWMASDMPAAQHLTMSDLNQDGYADIVLDYNNLYNLNESAPKAFINARGSKLISLTSDQLYGDIDTNGAEIMPVNLNGDGLLDAAYMTYSNMESTDLNLMTTRSKLKPENASTELKNWMNKSNAPVNGTAKNDTLHVYAGDHKIDGKAGTDTLNVYSNFADCQLTVNSQTKSFNLQNSVYGTNDIYGVEFIKFQDQTIGLDYKNWSNYFVM
jgi:hypothetical protein